jgi:hypothetical protein
VTTKRLLKGVIVKSDAHTCMVSTEVHSMNILVKGVIPSKYMETIKLSDEHANNKYTFNHEVEGKPDIFIKAKLHLLTRESIIFLSLLNTNQFSYIMDLYLYNVHTLGLRLSRTAYQFYHQIWHKKNSEETIVPVSENFQYL